MNRILAAALVLVAQSAAADKFDFSPRERVTVAAETIGCRTAERYARFLSVFRAKDRAAIDRFYLTYALPPSPGMECQILHGGDAATVERVEGDLACIRKPGEIECLYIFRALLDKEK